MSKKHGNWKKQPSYSQEKLKEAREVYRLQQEAADNPEVVVNIADIADETLDESSLTLEDKLGSVGEDDVLNLPAASENYLTPADNWLNLPDTTINPLKLPLADDLGDDLI